MDNPYGLQRYGTADLGDLMDRITKNSIGLDTYFENIFNVGQQQSYPPYNIVHVSNVESRLEIALAGFKEKEKFESDAFSSLQVKSIGLLPGSSFKEEETKLLYMSVAEALSVGLV